MLDKNTEVCEASYLAMLGLSNTYNKFRAPDPWIRARTSICEQNKLSAATDISGDGKPTSFFIYCDVITEYTGLTPKIGRSGHQSNKEKNNPKLGNRTIGVEVVCGPV